MSSFFVLLRVSADGVDLFLDCLCGDDTNKGISITKPLGKYVLYGTGNVVTGETKSLFSFAKSVSRQTDWVISFIFFPRLGDKLVLLLTALITVNCPKGAKVIILQDLL